MAKFYLSKQKYMPKPVLPSRRKFRCFVGSTVLYCQGPMGQDNISSLPRGHAFKLTGHRSRLVVGPNQAHSG